MEISSFSIFQNLIQRVKELFSRILSHEFDKYKTFAINQKVIARHAEPFEKSSDAVGNFNI